MDIQVKRIYEPADEADGARFLVDRLWPRGISKEKAALTAWLKDVAPSDRLRKQFHTQVYDWDEFVSAYVAELKEADPSAGLATIHDAALKGPVTLLFASKQEDRNHASILRDFIEQSG